MEKKTTRKPRVKKAVINTVSGVNPIEIADDSHRPDFLAAIEEPIKEDSIIIAPVVPIEAVIAPPKVRTIHLKIAVDQKGIDVPNAMGNQIFAEFTGVTSDEKPLDIAKAAGYLGSVLFSQIRMFKSRKAGFNLSFSIDNKLFDSFQTKSSGRIKMGNPSDLAFGIADLLLTAFNVENTDSYLTGKVENSRETTLFVDRLGLKEAKKLPQFMLEGVIDLKRRSIKKNFYTAKKEAIAAMALN